MVLSGRRPVWFRAGLVWLLWAALFALASAIQLWERSELTVANVVVMYLLLVVGGSVAGGRRLGITLVIASYLIINYSFIPPYGDLQIEKQSDWLIMIGLMAVGLTTSELLTRFREQADIADRRAAEIESLSVERERLRQEAARTETLRDAERLKNALLASASHDLRTPLQTILSLTHDAAARGDTTANHIAHEATRLNEYVSSLLDWSRTRDGAVALRLEFNTAEDLIGAAVRAVRRVAEHHRVQVRIESDASELLAGTFDFSLALRALVNLVENAAKYAPPDTAIEVVASRDTDWLVIKVLDRGPGIPDGDGERIFEPFYRSTSSNGKKGSGLGLAIAREFARVQRGDVIWISRPGGGSSFRLTLPLASIPDLGDDGTAAANDPLE